ncbi:MAG: VTT domain-containing protein [Pirellulales bacterium]
MLKRALVILGLCLLVPVVPFVIFGPQLEQTAQAWLEAPHHQSTVAAATVGLLAADILLPIPSSAVATFAGSQLGWWQGTAWTWLGLTLGSCLGFWLARSWGPDLLARLVSEDDQRRLTGMLSRVGPVALAVTRALPILAEAMVLLAGAGGVSWRAFWWPVALSNLGLALAYAGLGQWAADRQWLPWALAASMALPVLLTAAVRRAVPAE